MSAGSHHLLLLLVCCVMNVWLSSWSSSLINPLTSVATAKEIGLGFKKIQNFPDLLLPTCLIGHYLLICLCVDMCCLCFSCILGL